MDGWEGQWHGRVGIGLALPAKVGSIFGVAIMATGRIIFLIIQIDGDAENSGQDFTGETV
jgi:hypothetical protein